MTEKFIMSGFMEFYFQENQLKLTIIEGVFPKMVNCNRIKWNYKVLGTDSNVQSLLVFSDISSS